MADRLAKLEKKLAEIKRKQQETSQKMRKTLREDFEKKKVDDEEEATLKRMEDSRKTHQKRKIVEAELKKPLPLAGEYMMKVQEEERKFRKSMKTSQKKHRKALRRIQSDLTIVESHYKKRFLNEETINSPCAIEPPQSPQISISKSVHDSLEEELTHFTFDVVKREAVVPKLLKSMKPAPVVGTLPRRETSLSIDC
eukprot:TRINITY_DN8293_c0_g1_i1.p1 TRINITY_DN8293_c0_g1~~TRINITY_DN8293_c0_g1_i1.p1  ORF type:complete len:197 (-),score=64.98 TRINITY_DN8293_c0_g1_i1:190-780(-)